MKFKFSKKIVTLFIIVLSAAVILGLKAARQDPAKSKEARTGLLAKVKGPDDAPIRIIEYVDFQCGSCAQAAEYLKDLMAKRPEQIRLEARYYPLRTHRHGFVSALYAECAARQGEFWPFYEELFKRQQHWGVLVDPRPVFEQTAKDVHLDVGQMKVCVEDEQIKEYINKSKEEGRVLRVQSTPTFFINERMIVGKFQLESELNRLLNEESH